MCLLVVINEGWICCVAALRVFCFHCFLSLSQLVHLFSVGIYIFRLIAGALELWYLSVPVGVAHFFMMTSMWRHSAW